MALFAALFGTRQLDATEHHEGVMLAIAFESLVKLLAFVAVGVFALLHLDGAPPLAATRLGDLRDVASPSFAASTLLAAAAIFCLPRQFLVGVVECADPADLRTARWLFPAYLAVFTVFVVPGGARRPRRRARRAAPRRLVRADAADGSTARPALAILVFLGGLSAATAMVIMASIALATMITNDLVMPALWRSRWLGIGHRRRRRAAWCCGCGASTIVLLALLAFAYHRGTSAPASLASIGLLAFAAVAQFAPAILAGLYWRGATREGVFCGTRGRLRRVDLRAAAADLRRRRRHRPAAARRRGARHGSERARAGRSSRACAASRCASA